MRRFAWGHRCSATPTRANGRYRTSREHLAKDDVRVGPTTKQVAGEAVTGAERDAEPAEGTAEAVFEGEDKDTHLHP
jgi:hypothetical protein